MNTKEKIAVMQAFVDGKKIEFKESENRWRTISVKEDGGNMLWDWGTNEYRIKKELVERWAVQYQSGGIDLFMHESNAKRECGPSGRVFKMREVEE